MGETLRMWKLARFFKRNYHSLAEWDHKDLFQSASNGEPIPKETQELLEISFQLQEPRVFRTALIAGFSQELCKKEAKGSKYVKEETIKSKTIDAQNRVLNCIAKQFIEFDEKDRTAIFLPLKGQKFATYEGLLKEWIIDDIGILWSVAGTVIVTAFSTNWNLAIRLTGYISPWW
ncbi:MAG: hypothetical protein AAB417_02000 [Patescibacteria group bacterium]